MPEPFCILDEHSGLHWYARETDEEAAARFDRECRAGERSAEEVVVWSQRNAYRRKPLQVRIAAADAHAIALTRAADALDRVAGQLERWARGDTNGNEWLYVEAG